MGLNAPLAEMHREPNPTPGYIRWLRAQVGPALVPLAYATAVIRDSAGRVLMQRRADFGDAWWGLPGGLFEPGESAEACLRREVREETGLEVAALRLTGVYSSPRYCVTYPNGDQAQQVTFCYECRVEGGSPQPQAGEVDAQAFFPPGVVPPMPPWYADMLAHALAERPEPYFDPPEQAALDTPFPDLMSLRPFVGHAPLLWTGASAAVRDSLGRLLLLRRGDFNTWGLPAGTLDPGESLAHTARREVREETGLDVEPFRLLGEYSGHLVTYPNGDQVYPVGALFACRLLGGQILPDGAETLEVRFFAQDELPPMPEIMQTRAALAFAADWT